MKQGLHYQQGLTIWSLTVLIAMVTFVCAFGLRLLPIYLENYNVKSSLNALKDEPRLKELGRFNLKQSDVKTMLERRFTVNDIRSVDLNQALQFERQSSGVRIGIKYQAKTDFMANIQLLVNFDESVEIALN